EITKITHAIKNTKKAHSKIKNNKPTKLFGLAATWNNKLNQGIISLPSLNKLLKVMIIEKIHKLSLHNSEQIYDTLIENVQRFWQKPNKFIKKALGNLNPSLDLSLLKNSNNDITDD